MKQAIAVLGPPAVGKSTIVKPYSKRVVQVGEYAHSLHQDHPLKQACIEHWESNRVFSPQLLEGLLRSCPLEEQDWYILDGTPRDVVTIPVVQKVFALSALIELIIDEDVWLERAQRAANNGRRVRYDSSLPQLLKRREIYEEKMQALRPCFAHHYSVDNSGDIETTRQQFSEVISEIFSGDKVAA